VSPTADLQISLARFFHTWTPWVVVVLGFFFLIFFWNSLHTVSATSAGLEFVVFWLVSVVAAYEVLLVRVRRPDPTPESRDPLRRPPERWQAILSSALQVAALVLFVLVEYYPRSSTACSGGLSCPGSPSPLAVALLLFLVCELLAMLFLTLACVSMTISDAQRLGAPAP